MIDTRDRPTARPPSGEAAPQRGIMGSEVAIAVLWSVVVLLLIALAGAAAFGVVLAFVGNAVVQLVRIGQERMRR